MLNGKTLNERIAECLTTAKSDSTEGPAIPLECTIWHMLHGDDRIEICNMSHAWGTKSDLATTRKAQRFLKTMFVSGEP